MTPKEVFEHHGAAIGKGDVDEILKDYTEDSVMFTKEGPLKGLKALRPAFEELVTKLMPPGGTSFEMKRMDILGDIVYICWSSESKHAKIPLGTDTFVIRNGKIVAQSFTAEIIRK
jgi:ketosteroid isomerase-like protein